MSLAQRVDAVATVWFEVSFDVPGAADPAWAVVRSVSGLGMTVGTTPLWEGGQWFGPHMLPGPITMTKLVLQGVVVEKTLFFDWFDKVKPGRVAEARVDGRILLRQSGPGGMTTVASWYVTGALPVTYTAPSLDPHQGVIALEKLEIVYESLERV